MPPMRWHRRTQSVRRRPWALCVFAFGLALHLGAQPAIADVCDSRGTLHPAISTLLFGVATRLDVPVPATWTLGNANDFAQRHLSRPRGSERLGEQARAHYEHLASKIRLQDQVELEEHLKAAGFIDAAAAAVGHFDYVLVHGSTLSSVRQRLHALAQAVRLGALQLDDDTQVVFLDGERPLFASETPAAMLDTAAYGAEIHWRAPLQLPTDERGMVELVWQQMPLPAALRARPVLFVHAQKEAGAARAETAGCVAAWVHSSRPPHAGRALMLSNNPFIEYQRRITATLLHTNGAPPLEVVAMGPAAQLPEKDPVLRMGLLLDSLAATLYRAREQELLGLLDGAEETAVQADSF